MIKTIPKKKKCKKAKWLSVEALQIAEERREAKGEGETEIYSTHLNAEFQTITRRDKKPFFIDQCQEIEENNGMCLAPLPTWITRELVKISVVVFFN